MAHLVADIRYGLRMIVKRPGTSGLAIAALALGIGLTTTMFSIVYGVILRGLPFEDGQRIVSVGRTDSRSRMMSLPVDDFADWRARQSSFIDLAAYTSYPMRVSAETVSAERYRAAIVTPNMLALLRVAPAKGRDFRDDDARPGAPAVALISHRVWQTQFESDPNVVGRVLRLNGKATEVIGVMPPKFAFPESEDVWLPLALTSSEVRGKGPTYQVVGRLQPGVSIARGEDELRRVAGQLEQEHVENKGISARVIPYVENNIGRDVIGTLYAMLGAVFGVLLIACANVTNLQLARALERAKEIAIRTAIGAGRWRVMRQMLVEGLLISAVGAGLGLLIAWGGVSFFNAGIAETNPPFWIDIKLDGGVLAFVLSITVLAALLSTLVPAFRATRRGAIGALKDQTRSATSLRAGVLTRVLVGGAVTLSTALLIVSGLMIKSVIEVGRTSHSFSTADVVMARTSLEDLGLKTNADRLNAVERIEEAMSSISGARGVAVGSGHPTSGSQWILEKEGETLPEDARGPVVRRISATPSYFQALRLQPVAGRLFDETDTALSPPVAVVTEDFATRYLGEARPVGRRIRLGRDQKQPLWTIIGVVPRLSSAKESDAIEETAFVPIAQAPTDSLTVLISAPGDPLVVVPDLRRAMRAFNPDLALTDVQSLQDFFHSQAWPYRVFGALFMAFGVAALVMAVAGLYGVLAFGVRLRTQEIGVRLALGADRPRVMRLILFQGMRVVGIGLALGLLIAYFLSPAMALLFYNVQPTDPFIFGGTALLLALTGIAASLVPALRAAGVDPLTALRNE